MKLGVLDFGIIQEGSNAVTTIHETIELAQKAEILGFSRYWLAEHHGRENAWRSPVSVITLISGFTNRIKVGAAGILLPLSNPLRIAQDFKLLENIFPNRIDLGIARGHANTIACKELLESGSVEDNSEKHFERIKKLIDFLNDNEEEIATPPVNGLIPEMWMLSTSGSALPMVVKQNCNFSLSLFHANINSPSNIVPSPDIISKFKELFYAQHGYYPKCNIAISGCCCFTDKQAKELKDSYNNIRVNVVGTKNEALDEILRIKELYGVDEIIWKDISRNNRDKNYSFETISNLINK